MIVAQDQFTRRNRRRTGHHCQDEHHSEPSQVSQGLHVWSPPSDDASHSHCRQKREKRRGKWGHFLTPDRIGCLVLPQYFQPIQVDSGRIKTERESVQGALLWVHALLIHKR